jgi:hypothetical protein
MTVDDEGHTVAVHGPIQKGVQPTDMSEWDPEIGVVCAWANIPSCRATDFPTLFTNKMNKWNDKGKLVKFKGEWMKPIDQRWLDAVLNGRKVASEDGRDT